MQYLLRFIFLVIVFMNFEVQAQNLDGTWVLQEADTSEYSLNHDTITVKGKRFETTIFNGVINSGRIKKRLFKKNEFKLKSCLYDGGDWGKCRVFRWKWEIISLSKNLLIIEQTRRISVPDLNNVHTGIYKDHVVKLTYSKIP